MHACKTLVINLIPQLEWQTPPLPLKLMYIEVIGKCKYITMVITEKMLTLKNKFDFMVVLRIIIFEQRLAMLVKCR